MMTQIVVEFDVTGDKERKSGRGRPQVLGGDF